MNGMIGDKTGPTRAPKLCAASVIASQLQSSLSHNVQARTKEQKERTHALRVLLHEALVERLELLHKVGHDLLAGQNGGAQVEGARLCMCARAESVVRINHTE